MFPIILTLWFALLPPEMAPNGKIDTLTVGSIERNRVVRPGESSDSKVIVDTITLKDEKDELITRREHCHLAGIKIEKVQNEFWICLYNPQGELVLIIRSKVLKETVTADLTPEPVVEKTKIEPVHEA